MAQAPARDRYAVPDGDALATFHPVIQEWFRRKFSAPTDAQAAGWPVIQAGGHAHKPGSSRPRAAFALMIWERPRGVLEWAVPCHGGVFLDVDA